MVHCVVLISTQKLPHSLSILLIFDASYRSGVLSQGILPSGGIAAYQGGIYLWW